MTPVRLITRISLFEGHLKKFTSRSKGRGRMRAGIIPPPSSLFHFYNRVQGLMNC